MKDTQDLIPFLLRQERTVVFGNLGRRVHVLCKALLHSVPHLEVAVVSPYYPFPTLHDRVQVYASDKDLVGKCELLLYLEPRIHQVLWKHPLAAHVAVFTSHWVFTTDGGRWTHVCYFHHDLPAMADRTQRLLTLQDMPLQARHVERVNYGEEAGDREPQYILRGYATDLPSEAHIIVDLTGYTRDVLEMYLKLWDAFDALLEREVAQRWVVCFPEPSGYRAFRKFTQRCLDKLFCLPMEHGNLTRLADILRVLPYYRSGTVDRTDPVVTSTFGGRRIVIPQTHREACSAAARYDLNPLLRNVFLIQE